MPNTAEKTPHKPPAKIQTSQRPTLRGPSFYMSKVSLASVTLLHRLLVRMGMTQTTRFAVRLFDNL